MSVTTEADFTLSAFNEHSSCLICGDQNPRSMKLSFIAGENGLVSAQFTPDKELQGYAGILHGGVIAALLDAAMTHCLFHKGIQAVTAELNIRYVKSVECNVTLEIRAWIIKCHSRLYQLKSEIQNQKQVVAWAEAKFIPRRVHKCEPLSQIQGNG